MVPTEDISNLVNYTNTEGTEVVCEVNADSQAECTCDTSGDLDTQFPAIFLIAGKIFSYSGGSRVNIELLGSSYMYVEGDKCISYFKGWDILAWNLGQPIMRHLEVNYDYEQMLIGLKATSDSVSIQDSASGLAAGLAVVISSAALVASTLY
mmetsp:Transcript_442/g.885  ORF Transcript_442/g.885 Transcript_442/m.885 type:complete len:152 (-) Transcript_442:60-515(-)